MKTTIQLGKIDYNGSGRKNCMAEIDIQLDIKRFDYDREDIHHNIHKAGNQIFVLSICGGIWNPSQTDYYTCGQCLDTILEFFPNNKLVKRVHALWQRWHLNDLHADCSHQSNPDKNCSITGYKYGCKWLIEFLPPLIIDEIQELIVANNNSILRSK